MELRFFGIKIRRINEEKIFMRILNDKKHKRRIVSNIIGVLCISAMMSAWHITQGMGRMEADKARQADVRIVEGIGDRTKQSEEGVTSIPQETNASVESENASAENIDIENTGTENANIENAATENTDIENAGAENTDIENAGTENTNTENVGAEDLGIESMNTGNLSTNVENMRQTDTESASSELDSLEIENPELGNTELEEEIYGNLIVTNRVESNSEEDFDPEKEFHFTIYVGEERYEYVLKTGESYSVENIPVGTTYRVEVADYLGEYYVNENPQSEGVILHEDNHMEFLHTLTPEPEVTRRIEAGEFSTPLEDVEDIPENVEVQPSEVNHQQQRNLRYEGEVSLAPEARPLVTTFWLVVLMLSTVILKIVVFDRHILR